MRRRLVVAGAVIAAAGAAAAAVALAGGSGGASGPEPPAKATGTGTVERRTLAERVTVEGTIGYAGETTVLARLSGTVTALPAIGDVIRRGQRLYALAGEPVLLMYGAVPAYRTLGEGVSEGKDVEQLERNLAILGYSPGTVDDVFTGSTAEAVSAWQEDLGLEATGEIELGRVAFLHGPQRVTELEATLGEALGGGGGGNGMVAWKPEAEEDEGTEEPFEAPQEDEEAEKPEEEHDEGEKDEEPPADHDEPPPAEEDAEETKAPPAEEPAEPSGREEEPEPEAESEPSSIPVLRTSSTRRVVTVALDPDQQSIAHRGQEVEVLLPGGAQVKGVVRRLAAVESSGEGGPSEESEAAVEATVALTGKHRIPALDGAAVSVLFTQRVRKQVLSVPLTALVAIGGERFAVYVREGGSRRRIVVTPGLAAEGYVEVKGKGLRAGMQVETGG